MKNQYVGDVGDYGKYGLLRFLAEHGITIGINWYLTKNDGSADGKFTKYLDKSEDKKYDPFIFTELKTLAGRKDKSVQMVEAAELIPGAVYYNSELTVDGSTVIAREINRRLWFNNSLLMLEDAELVFADPDNGITYRKQAGTKDSEKYILPEEVVEYYDRGQNVVFYCHKGRRKEEAWEQAKVEIKKYLRDAQIIVMTFHRGTQRSYIFVLHPDDYERYASLLAEFEKTAWGEIFDRETVAVKSEWTDPAIDNILLEPVPGDFSVCKVPDYTGVDFDQPFVFTGSTDEEKSLVCPTAFVPENTLTREDGWRAFRICGELDFSMVGILAGITRVLTVNGISIFAISTYNTDYVLTKASDYDRAMKSLKASGYHFRDNR